MNNTSNLQLQTKYFISLMLFILTNINKIGKFEKFVSFFINETLNLFKHIFFHKIFEGIKPIITNVII